MYLNLNNHSTVINLSRSIKASRYKKFQSTVNRSILYGGVVVYSMIIFFILTLKRAWFFCNASGPSDPHRAVNWNNERTCWWIFIIKYFYRLILCFNRIGQQIDSNIQRIWNMLYNSFKKRRRRVFLVYGVCWAHFAFLRVNFSWLKFHWLRICT